MQRQKKEVFICSLEAFQTLDGKIHDSFWKHILLTLQLYSAVGRKVGFYIVREPNLRFLTIIFHSTESKTTAW